MPALILYLLKVNIALLLFYLAYYFVLRRLTFYHLNRLFLVFGMLFSFLYPFINMSVLLSQREELMVSYKYAAIPSWAPTITATPEQTTAFDYWLIPVMLFWFGTVVMAGRLILQFLSLSAIHRASEPASYQGIDFRKISGIREAFSFWQTIYLNPVQHKAEELESILRHEQIHVNGWHTLDVLLAELSTLLYWFNPGGWLLKKAIKENLEFIADQHVMSAGTDRKKYQYLLLKAAGTSEPQLANQFNFPSLKRRIIMMNKRPSTRTHLLKFLTIIPVATALLLFSTGAAQKQATTIKRVVTEVRTDEPAQNEPDLPEDQKTFLKRNPTVKSVSWMPHDINKMVISLKSGSAEVYDLNDSRSVAAAKGKYGELPALPPPPPPALVGQQLPPEVIPDVHVYVPDASTAPEDYKNFLKRNPEVEHVRWEIKITDGSPEIQIFMNFKSGEIDAYDLNDEKSVSAAEAKYGELPAPPSPAPAGQQLPPEVIPSVEVYVPDASTAPEDYKNFLKKNPEVDRVGWIIREKGDSPENTIIMFFKSGGSEIYDLNDEKSISTVENRYGKLLKLPPPPPPVRSDGN
ncbi:M56 family metallopeptidase [Pontibacter pamirensis]|uniref:M56 family metallopeptidase n=1 Tax=Pontibacter pamirensis TaxID=2562824 RepID=UPI0013894E6C|nr:M56 family metallopeptidase [Pontibacter pamirensis]